MRFRKETDREGLPRLRSAERDRRFVHDRVLLSRHDHGLVAEPIQEVIETTAP